MAINGHVATEEVELSQDEISRYSRHLIMPEVGIEGQKKLKAAKVLLIGTGGLGSPTAMYLAAAGIGTLGLVDYDVVDASNLQRQIIHGSKDVGKTKLDSAEETIKDINPYINVIQHHVPLTSENALEIIEPYDIVVDGTDNFPTRYLVNDACLMLGKPNVYGSIFRFEGQVTVFDFRRDDTPSYRCMFPEPPPPGLVPSCAEGGVLGILPGTIGTMQATEAIKLILGIGDSLVGRMLLYDALNMEFRTIKLRRAPNWPIGEPHPTVTELIDYEQFCGVPAHDRSTYGADEQEKDEIPTTTVLDVQQRINKGEGFVLLDVREPHEWAISDIEGATHHIRKDDVIKNLDQLDRDEDIVVYCRTGGRSSDITKLLLEQGYTRVWNMAGGINKWALEVDDKLPVY